MHPLPNVGDTREWDGRTWTFQKCPDDKFGWCYRAENGELVRGDGCRFETPQPVADARVQFQIERMAEQLKREEPPLRVVDRRSSRQP